MPDVAAGGEGAQARAVILGDEDAVQDALTGADLIGTHDEQVVRGVEDAVMRQHHEEGALR